MKKCCLLLTATIAPSNIPSLKRVNIQDREHDYLKSLESWLKMQIPIVFVENSDYKSEKIETVFKDQRESEYLKFKSKKSFLGKGHGEAEIIQYAFENSTLIRKFDIVIKVTGRLFVNNFFELISPILTSEQIFVISNFYNNLLFADSRLIIANKFFFTSYLIKEFPLLDETNNVYFEHIFANAVHRSIADGYQWRLPSKMPLISGFSGTGNVEYKYSMFYVLKQNVMLYVLRLLLKRYP